MWRGSCGLSVPAPDLARTKKVVRVQDGIGNVRILFETPANGCGNGLSRLPAKPGAFCQLDAKATHCAYFATTWRNLKDNAQLCLHAFFDMPQVGIAENIFNARDEFLLILGCQPQYAKIAARILQQVVPIAGAGTGWALLANRKRDRLEHRDHTADQLS